ncbi:mucin-17-like isoform X2 [Cimex lectularius]|uniref:PPM-type phosphatase domain-containing protein n=1 Tax=Cimex lectularius TaxID=79782 RepID=A0A8I6TCU7_CIMLE|nr:mucin-17-like isoform X2 [Cimex lectularius]
MEDTSQDYLTKYREFFEALVKNCDLSNPLLVNNIPKYSLTQSEISGEILHWCLRYLSDRDCPTNLAALLCHKAYLEVIELCNKSPDLCGYKSQEDDYNSLKLVQVTIKKLVELCKGYSDNAMLSMLPPPPLDRLYDPILSVCAIKNGRRKMEDRHVLIQDLHALFNLKDCGSASYYAVFDGHNGTDAATYSCAHLHQFLVENENYPHYPEKALSQAFQQTDERFIDKSKKNMDHLESGTTAVCVLLRPYEKKLYTAWLGDSQAILVSRGGKLKCLVNPHRPSRKDERERIESMGGDVLWLGMYRVNGFLAVSRAIGDKKYKPYVTSEPDIKTINLVGDEEFLVIASDGLWDFINPDVIMNEVYQYIAEKTAPIEDLAKHLVQLAKISSEDNISVVVVFLTDPNSLSGLVSLPSAAKKRKTCPVRTRRLVKHVEKRRCEKGMDDVKISVRWPHDHVNQHNGSEATHFTEQDMGPETDVDAADDMMVPPIVRAKALVDQANTMESWIPKQKLGASEQNWLKSLPWSYAEVVKNSPPKKEAVQNDSNDVAKAALDKEVTEPLDQPKEELEKTDEKTDEKPEIENKEGKKKANEANNDVADGEVESEEESEEEWNYTPGKENKGSSSEQNLDEQDMSQLNPNAAEFVPIFNSVKETVLASSPMKGAEQNLENIKLPSKEEFYLEISQRPGDLDSLSNERAEHVKDDSLNCVDLTLASTKVEVGDESFEGFDLSGENVKEATSMPLNETNPFSQDKIQEEMVQDHFDVTDFNFKTLEPKQSVVDDDNLTTKAPAFSLEFLSDKPDILSPIELNPAHTNLDHHTSSSGFDSESGNDEPDLTSTDKCDLVSGISFMNDCELEKNVVADEGAPLSEGTDSPAMSSPVVNEKEIDSSENKKLEEVSNETVPMNNDLMNSIYDTVGSAFSEGVEHPDLLMKETDLTNGLVNEVSSPQESATCFSDLKDELTLAPEPEQTVPEEKEHMHKNPFAFDMAENLQTMIPDNSLDVMEQSVKEESVPKEKELHVDSLQTVDFVQDLCFSECITVKSNDSHSENDGFELINTEEDSSGMKQLNGVPEPNVNLEASNPDQNNDSVTENLIENVTPTLEINQSLIPGDMLGSFEHIEKCEVNTLHMSGDLMETVTEESEHELSNLEKVVNDLVQTEVGHVSLEEIKSENTNEENLLLDEINTESKNVENVLLDEIKTESKNVENVLLDEIQLESPNVENNVKLDDTKSESTNVENNVLLDEIKSESTNIENKLMLDEIKSESTTIENNLMLDEIKPENTHVESSVEIPLEEVQKVKEQHEDASHTVVEQVPKFEDSFSPVVEETKNDLVSESQPEVPAVVSPELECINVDVDSIQKFENEIAVTTPPTTPAPGLAEENKEGLIAAAVAAAGAAAVVAATSQPSKTEDKTSVKKTTAVGAKKPEVKTTAKTATTAKTTARPTTTTLAAKKPAAATAKAPARPTTTSAKPAAPKPSTPTSKVASNKPSSKPSTPTSKTPTSPAGGVKSAITKTSVTGTTKAPLAKTAAPAAAKPKVASTVAAKPAPKTEVKKEVKTAAPAPRPSSAKLTSSRPSSATSTTKSTTAKPPTTTTAKLTSTAKPSQVLKSTTTTKAPVASKPAVSKVTAKPSSTTSTLKTATTKTTTTAKATTTTAAPKPAPATKPKTAAPTVVKKPLANDKSAKETTNLKLSTTKTAVAKKTDIKGKSIEKKVANDSLAQQVPTVTTTNGHNGLINGVTSHDDSSHVEIIDALN